MKFTHTPSRLSIFWAFLLVVFVLAGCASESKETLVIYSPHGKEMLERFELIFEEAHPEVDVQWIDMGGQSAYDRIRTERERPQASLWWGGSSMAFDRAAREGLLEPYRPTWADAVTDEMHHPSDMWYGTFLTPEVIAFNNQSLAGLSVEELPVDWDVLLDPVWKDRILIRSPLASATMRTIFGAMIMRQPTVEEGYAWLARLDINTKSYASDPTQLVPQTSTRGRGCNAVEYARYLLARTGKWLSFWLAYPCEWHTGFN